VDGIKFSINESNAEKILSLLESANKIAEAGKSAEEIT
jgi:hypothetical protein